jgi:hypothetical protein
MSCKKVQEAVAKLQELSDEDFESAITVAKYLRIAKYTQQSSSAPADKGAVLRQRVGSEKASEVKALLKMGKTCEDVATILNLNVRAVKDIHDCVTYRHIKEKPMVTSIRRQAAGQETSLCVEYPNGGWSVK